MATVTIQGITKSYQPGVPVLKPIDLVIDDGELFFLLGPSGCGKSTLLRILAGLVEPCSGSIYFDDEEITRLPAEKRRSAMVFQNYALWPHMTVFENVAFGLRAEHARAADIRREVEAALEVVKLQEFAARKVTALSGGQQQRVALARALAVRPRLLLLDEPLSNLDARLRDTMRCEIRRICKERALTAVYVTHDRQEALSMADRLAVMHDGVIQQLGAPQEVYDRPVNRFVAGFLGDSNFLEGESDGAGHFRCQLGEFALDGNAPAGSCTAAIRPERIFFAAADAPDSFPATLIEKTYLGDHSEWIFETTDGTRLLVSESAPPPRRKGDLCRLSFHSGHLIALEK